MASTKKDKPKDKPKKYQPVLVHWRDITSCAGWRSSDVHIPSIEMRSVGIYLGIRPGKWGDELMLAQSLNVSGDIVGETITFPIKCVEGIVLLKEDTGGI